MLFESALLVRYPAQGRGKIQSYRRVPREGFCAPASSRAVWSNLRMGGGSGHRMSISPCRAQGWNATLVRTLHENVSDRLSCLFQAGAGRKLEDFRMIERIFDTDRFGRGRVLSGSLVGRREGFGSVGLRRRWGWLFGSCGRWRGGHGRGGLRCGVLGVMCNAGECDGRGRDSCEYSRYA